MAGRLISSVCIPPLPTCRTNGSKPRNVSMATLCPNEKMVDERRFIDVHGGGGIDKSFQPHSVVWAHPDHAHLDPRRVNPADYRQPDVYKSLLAF